MQRREASSVSSSAHGRKRARIHGLSNLDTPKAVCGQQLPYDAGKTAEESDLQERQYFLEVCSAYYCHRSDASQQAFRLQAAWSRVAAEDQAIWNFDCASFLERVDSCIDANSKFLELLPCADVCEVPLGKPIEAAIFEVFPVGAETARHNEAKVRLMLRQFVRDWAVEGQAERSSSYTPLINALERHLPARPNGDQVAPPRVLCPGSGLGRLPFELARRGYVSQGNEFSYHMLLGSHLILSSTTHAEMHTIFPYVLEMTGRRCCADNLRAVKIPDICPASCASSLSRLSIRAGEFVHLYAGDSDAWDAVVTCFFLDTAPNVISYVQTIARILRVGGIWANFGPLLYHGAVSGSGSSIELSWEDLKSVICRYFTISEESWMDTSYTANCSSLSRHVFRCVCCVAIRNEASLQSV